ncbi:MAG: substrate-binding domain-containing protein [Pseudomonadota bacterium]
MRLIRVLGAVMLGVILGTTTVVAQGQRILVQSTTSTQNSGLYDYLVPLFEAETGLNVAVVAVGTGQAIRNAEAGDADVLLVHAKAAEEAFVAAGHGVRRYDLMYNDFVIIGPENDPLGLAAKGDLDEALVAMAAGDAILVSRGDDSGTHKAELRLWRRIGAVPADFGTWYRETGSGMGATIRVAVQTDGYVLADRATWIAYQDKGNHDVLFEGDSALFNQYGIIAVNPDRHPHVNADGAQKLINWLLGEAGQSAIAGFRRGGQQLFFPNAVPVR